MTDRVTSPRLRQRSVPTSVLLAALTILLSGCYCYTGDEFVCDLRAVVVGPSTNEIAGCRLVGQAQACVNCVRVEENGSFEYWMDEVPALWSGDSVRVQTRQRRIVDEAPPDPILPCSWQTMLQMMAATPTGPGQDVVGEVYQVIDLRGEVLPDPPIAVADGMVNRINRAFSDTQFGLALAAYRGDPAAFPGGGETLLVDGGETLHTDGDVDTWEWLSAVLDLPAETDFLVVTLQVFENARNETSEAEFFGHYLDGLRVQIGQKGAYDLRLAQSASRPSARTGEEVTFTLRLTHEGLLTRLGVGVALTLDEGLALIGTAGDGTYDPATQRWTLATLAPRETVRLDVRTRITAEPNRDTRLASRAAIAVGADGDVVPGNNEAVAGVNVPRFVAYDLALAQAVGQPTVMQGDSVRFTLTLANQGPDEANALIRVENVLPEGFTPQRYTASHGSYRGDIDRWALDTRETIPAGRDALLEVTAIAGIPGTVSDPARIQSGLGNQDDPANNRDSVSVTVTPATTPYDLALTVEAEQSPFPADGFGGFLFRLRNNGPTIATGIVVQDVPPSGPTFAAHRADTGTYDAATQQWSVPILLPGQTVELLKRFDPAPVGSYVHGATIIAGVDTDPDPGNDVDSATLTIVPVQPYDLVVATAFPDTLLVGEEADLVVTLTNTGPGLTTPIQVRVPIQPFLGYLSHTGEGTYLPHLALWTPERLLSAGESVTLTVRVRANRVGSGDLSGEIISNQDRDTRDGNDESRSAAAVFESVQLLTPIPDQTLAVGQVVRLDMDDFFSVPSGFNTYTAVLRDTSIAKLLDPILIVPDTVVQASLAGEFGLFAEQPGTAEVTVTAVDFDGFSAADTFRVTVTAAPYDLEARVSSSTSEYAPGQTIPYSVQVLKDPPTVGVSGIEVQHRVPDGLVYLNHTAVNGSYDPGTGVWALDLPTGTNVGFLAVNARADTAGVWTAEAVLTAGLGGDTDPSNDTASFTLTVEPRYFLSMTVNASADTVAAGNQVLIDLLVGNAGGNTATGVEVTFNLPAGLTYVSDETDDGAYDPGTGVWTIGNVVVGPFAALRITAEAAAIGTWSSTAAITAGLDGDQDADNNTDDVTVVVTAAQSATVGQE